MAVKIITFVQFRAHLVALNPRQDKVWENASVINSVYIMFKGNFITKANKPAEQYPDLNIIQNTKKPNKDMADIQESQSD